MSRRIVYFTVFLTIFCLNLFPAQAGPFEVTNIKVAVQAKNAVKARDHAITKAQRIAFATLVGKPETAIASVSDAQIARLVRGFSLRNERLAARSYGASFSVRFNPGAAQNFARSVGLTISPQAFQGEIAAVTENPSLVSGPAAAGTGVETTAPTTPPVPEAPAVEAVKAIPSIIILPVLDIGSRRIVWDEPNPWRDMWQKTDHSTDALKVQVPLGDISDVTDIPDGDVVTGGNANIQALLERYQATDLYIVLAKNQSASAGTPHGLALAVYAHDGRKLRMIRKTLLNTRPGYLFDDAVPAAMQIILASVNGGAPATDTAAQTAAPETPVPEVAAPVSGPVTVTIPYQSLPQWVGIQRRLRLVQGIKSILPMRVSSSSAQVRVVPSGVSLETLKNNLALQGFNLQNLPNGEMALTEK